MNGEVWPCEENAEEDIENHGIKKAVSEPCQSVSLTEEQCQNKERNGGNHQVEINHFSFSKSVEAYCLNLIF